MLKTWLDLAALKYIAIVELGTVLMAVRAYVQG